MLLLILGLLLFIGAHLLPTFASVKSAIVERAGAVGLKGVITVPSLLGVVLICFGYPDAKATGGFLYAPPTWIAHIALLLMLAAFVLFVSSRLPGMISKATKHPQLLSVKVWALAHLLANGDVADLILFGSLLAWAVYARISAKKRERAGLLAPASGGPVRNDITAVVVGGGLYVLFVVWAHKWLFGVPPIS